MRALLAAFLVGALVAGCITPSDEPADVLDPKPNPSWSFLDDGDLRTDLGQPAGELGSPGFGYTGYSGAEPNIGITPLGNIFVTAFDSTLRSSDGGQTWETVLEYNPIQGTVDKGTSDPMMAVDPVTGRIYVNHMVGLYCFTMYWSDDEGNTWTQRDMACREPGVDHQKVAAGPYGPESHFTRGTWSNPVRDALPQEAEDPACTTSPVGCPGNPSPFNPVYPSVVYTCYQKVPGAALAPTPGPSAMLYGQEVCMASYDGGLTYPVESIVFEDDVHGCGGASGHPAISANGTIAIAHGWQCGPLVGISKDSGASWTVRTGPTEWGVGVAVDPDVAWGPDGALFLMYKDGSQGIRLARSNDLGATWTTWNVTAPGLTSTYFHVVSTGSQGRLAMAYLGTEHVADASNETWGDWDGSPSGAPPDAVWHLYIATTQDADAAVPTFNVYQVTPDDDPVQVGCVWEGGGSGGERVCRNMLDFIDSTVHPDGTFYVVYTEGCTVRRECTGNFTVEGTPPPEMNSRDRQVATAWVGGWSLYEKPGFPVYGRHASSGV